LKKSKETAYLNKKVELAPDVILKSGLAVQHKRFKASWQIAYTSQQFADATNAIRTDNAAFGLIPMRGVIF
jgi:Fe(3+) dicitrate transport protein